MKKKDEINTERTKVVAEEALKTNPKWLKRLSLVALAAIITFTTYITIKNVNINSAIKNDSEEGILYMNDVPINEVSDYYRGYDLVDGDLVKYDTKQIIEDVINPTITTYYTVPNGYTLRGQTGYRTYTNNQGEEITDTVPAVVHTIYTVPEGYVLENGKGVKYITTQTDKVLDQITEVSHTFNDDYGNEVIITSRLDCDELSQDYIKINNLYIKKAIKTSLTNEKINIAIELSEDEQVPNGFVRFGNYAIRESVLKYIPSLTQENTQTKSK